MTSYKLLFSFTVTQLHNLPTDKRVAILSVFKGKLLVSGLRLSQLFIYNTSGSYLSSVKINNRLWDAKWTPRGNIIYTSAACTVGMVSKVGGIIIRATKYQMKTPRYLSIDNNVIYITDVDTGLFRSTDDGVSWNLVFKAPDEWACEQVIKVNSNPRLIEDFWMVVRRDQENYALRVYSVDKRRTDIVVTWKNVTALEPNGRTIKVSYRSRLSYDGKTNIFLSNCFDEAVHVFSVNGLYQFQIRSSSPFQKHFWRLEFDRKSQLLFAGKVSGSIDVIQLT